MSTIQGGARGDKTRPRVDAPTAPVPTPFSGTFDPNPFPCASAKHQFIVPAGQARIVVQVIAQVQANDITVTLLFGPGPNPVFVDSEDTGLGSEALVYEPAGGVPPGVYQVQICQAGNAVTTVEPRDYNGIFTYDDTLAGGGTPTPTPVPSPAPQDSGPKIGYENFTAPGVLTPVKTTEAGQQVNSVEYLGRNAGEPSIGANWVTGVVNFQSGLQTLFITFNDSCPANGQSSTWVNRAAPTAVVIDSDPIGFTDRGFTDPLGAHSRVFAAHLTLLSPSTCKISHTDDDGVTWIGPDQSGGPGSGVDHQSMGAGPYRNALTEVPPVVGTPTTTYPNAVYYCSQDIATAFCARSDNGGLTYGPNVPLYSLLNCGGLHGHVKVTPLTPATGPVPAGNGQGGTVYVPNPECNTQAVIVSKDNGVSWIIRNTPIAVPGGTGVGSDPAVGIDSNGRVYFLGAANGSAAVVATSTDTGQTWQNLFDVSSVFGVKQVAFPAAVAGDAGRAAVAFYGSTTAGANSNEDDFPGVWHLYVSHTFNGGLTWTTTNVTPNAPMQRSGLLRGGGANITRNLLDFFDITIDNQGRVLVGYVNGCEGGNCAQAVSTATGNAYSTTATIARQSSGRRMRAAFDPPNPLTHTEAPGMPSVTQRRVGNLVHLQWSLADSGNLMINNYQILRGTVSNGETLLTTVTGTQIGGNYTDVLPANDTTTYFYKVLAVNSAGSSCGNNEVAAPFVGDYCSGIIIHRNDPTHPEANAGMSTPASLLIDYIAVAEPPGSPGNFVFKMKVNSLANVPINSRWRITWNSHSSPGQQYYVGMKTGPSGPPTFQYGHLADAGVPAVFVISEQSAIPALPGSNFNADGTITVIVPKSAFGNPAPGDLLGAVGGRTFTGDTPSTETLQRSNAMIDHTFVKAQSDNSYPPATYTVAGNNASCGSGLAAVGAVSRKTHGSAGDFDINLPFIGSPGIECRTGGASNNHKVVVTFPVPVTVGSATVTPGAGGTGSVSGSPSVNGSVVTVNLTNVSNAQTLVIHLLNVSDGTNTANVDIPMSVLLGDTTANKAVNSSDVSQTKAQSGTAAANTNFRTDVTVNGLINSSDTAIVKSKSGTGIP